MRSDITIVSIVAVIALVGLVMVGNPTSSGAFVTRPTVKIIQTMTYDSAPGANLCQGSRGQCKKPDCATGLARVKMPGDITRYQWMVIPRYMIGQQLGGCCDGGTRLLFQVEEDFKEHRMALSCGNGRWSAAFV